jgi:hypothetical protein
VGGELYPWAVMTSITVSAFQNKNDGVVATQVIDTEYEVEENLSDYGPVSDPAVSDEQ